MNGNSSKGSVDGESIKESGTTNNDVRNQLPPVPKFLKNRLAEFLPESSNDIPLDIAYHAYQSAFQRAYLINIADKLNEEKNVLLKTLEERDERIKKYCSSIMKYQFELSRKNIIMGTLTERYFI